MANCAAAIHRADRDANPNKVKAVMDAMMTMVKLDVAGPGRTYDGA